MGKASQLLPNIVEANLIIKLSFGSMEKDCVLSETML